MPLIRRGALTITEDILNNITITAEKDALGLTHKETRKNATSGRIIPIAIPIRFGRDLVWPRLPMNLTASPAYR